MQLRQWSRHQTGASRLKLTSVILLLAVFTLICVRYGPVLLGYYRFSQSVEQASQASLARGGPWPQFNAVCMPCHGATGQSLNASYPSLAGQPALYLSEQLQAFASGQRANPIMSSLAIDLSAAQIDQLADFYAAQPAATNGNFKPDPKRREEGRQLVVQNACASCHGTGLQGQAAFPRLAGQGYDYLLKQLRAYKAGSRIDTTGAMIAVLAPLTDRDLADTAAYLASHPGVPLDQ